MRRNNRVQMAIEDASDWDDGTLEDYIVNLEKERDELKARVDEIHEIVKAVAHIGIDFGYGPYVLDQELIDRARFLYEKNEGLT